MHQTLIKVDVDKEAFPKPEHIHRQTCSRKETLISVGVDATASPVIDTEKWNLVLRVIKLRMITWSLGRYSPQNTQAQTCPHDQLELDRRLGGGMRGRLHFRSQGKREGPVPKKGKGKASQCQKGKGKTWRATFEAPSH